MSYKPVIIAGIQFPSIKAAVKHCRRILYDGPTGSAINGTDSEFVEHLWLNRPDKLREYTGRRVVSFERRYREGNEKWSQCFWAVFEDGGAVDFSFNKAINNMADALHQSCDAA